MTTDNGSNMLKMIKLLNTATNDNAIEDECEDDECEENNASENEQLNSVEYTNNEVEEILNEIEYEALLGDELSEDDEFLHMLIQLENEFRDCPCNVSGVRCAAHTLQLVVNDALKKSKATRLILLCRKAAKMLRTQNFQHELLAANLGNCYIRLDVKTRWNSTYLMVSIFF